MRRSFIRYAVVAVWVALAVVAVGLALPVRERFALWVGAALAAVVQAICYAALCLASSRRPRAFLAAWAGGVLMRFLSVVAFAVVVSRFAGLEPAPALLGLVGVLFALLLLEPLGLPRAAGAVSA